MDRLLNETQIDKIVQLSNTTDVGPKRHLSFESQIVLTLVYIIGVVGNVSALIILFHKDKRRNRKHLLMLRCLAMNDLVALLGMLMQMYVTIYVGRVTTTRAFCSLRVVWRLFGLFSGCVAIVMAVERWLALTRPFVYQKQVTFPVIVQCMLLLWLAALALTSLPLFGFGIYYKDNKCERYRNATEPVDVAYAYLWFFYGTILCVSIVWCNLTVSRALKRLGRRNGVLRRISRASSRCNPLLTASSSVPSEIGMTAEERAFARLMAVLSLTFVICWMPQMISIPLSQYQLTLSPSAAVARKAIRAFHIIADILLCIHFALDPYIYVLLRMPRPRISVFKSLCRICWPAGRTHDFMATSMDNRGSCGDPPTPPTSEVPSTPVSEDAVIQLAMVSV